MNRSRGKFESAAVFHCKLELFHSQSFPKPIEFTEWAYLECELAKSNCIHIMSRDLRPETFPNPMSKIGWCRTTLATGMKRPQGGGARQTRHRHQKLIKSEPGSEDRRARRLARRIAGVNVDDFISQLGCGQWVHLGVPCRRGSILAV